MLKKVIKYVDYNDEVREETFYFHLSEADLAAMELSVKGGLTTLLEQIVKDQDGEKIVKFIDELIKKSVGIKSEDGRLFKRSPEIAEEFSQTAAYSALFMELTTQAEAAVAFVEGLMPKNLLAAVKAQQDVKN